jgi:hypothetical protein
LNFDIQTQWNANDISGKSMLYYPPRVPAGITLDKTGLLTVDEADSSVIYDLHVRAADAGKISDTKVLRLSGGLDIVHELICGADSRFKHGEQASLKLILTNNGLSPVQNLVLKLRPADSLVQVTDSVYVVPTLNPGQTLTIPEAFSFSLRQALSNNFPVMMTLLAQTSARAWKKELMFPVAAAEFIVESPSVTDGYNGRLDPGEVADLLVNVKNVGGLGTRNMQLQLISTGQVISILSASQVAIDQFDALSSKDFIFQIKASRDALPGNDIALQLMLSDTSGVIQTIQFNLQIGTKPVALANLATSQASVQAMIRSLDSLHVGHDFFNELSFDFSRYESVFLILGTASTGAHVLSESEVSALVAFLNQGGKLYLESYYTWYYFNETLLHPMFKYTSKKVPAYFYPDIEGTQGAFTDSMSFVYTAPMSYAIFDIEPVVPAYSTLNNDDNPARSLEVVYDGDDYKTIGTMLDFSALSGGLPPSTQTTLMQRYLEFFELNIAGPWPLFHASATALCTGHEVTFTDDSFDNIVTRSWEFQGGTPAGSTEANPVVRYDATGKFDVKLTVSDGVHTTTLMKQQYIRVDQCSGIGKLQAAAPLFKIYPNPATNFVNIEIDRNIIGPFNLRINDLTGCKIMELEQSISTGNFIALNLSGVRKGFYLMTIQVGHLTSTMKLIKN